MIDLYLTSYVCYLGIDTACCFTNTILGWAYLWNSSDTVVCSVNRFSCNLPMHQEQVRIDRLCYSSYLKKIHYITTCDRVRDVLHRGDRAMIYIFIASSYFPWLSLSPHLTSGGFADKPSSLISTLVSWIGLSSLAADDFRWFVWFMAAVGILYQQIFHEKYKWLETLFYVLIGLLPSLPFVHLVIFTE